VQEEVPNVQPQPSWLAWLLGALGLVVLAVIVFALGLVVAVVVGAIVCIWWLVSTAQLTGKTKSLTLLIIGLVGAVAVYACWGVL
jgi:uncharacterized membrane protein YidH (DUF202 family)